MKKIFLILFLLCFSYEASFAHKEWVHQYIVKEAFKLLKAEFPGRTFTNLETYLGKDFSGSGDQDFYGHSIYYSPWRVDNSIVVGSYAEDLVDLIYHYQSGLVGFFDGWTPSSTHFWNADRGDNALTLIPASHDLPNAWKKTRMYFFAEQEDPNFGMWMPFGNKIATSKGVFTVVAFRRTYRSLCDFYATGEERVKDGHDAAGRLIPINITYTHDDTERRKFAYYIFGRILHLLADMSVPAHVHDDTHPCDLGDGDIYELFMGNNDAGVHCNDEHDNPSHSTAITSNICRQKGGLFWEVFSMTDRQALRYLFYTQNRISAHFASFNQNDNLQDGGNHNLANGTNPLIDAKFLEMGSPSNDKSDNDLISTHAFTNSIRATATMLLWFEMKMNQLDCSDILRLQNDNFFGMKLPSPSSNLASFDANQKIIAGSNVYPSGSDVPMGQYIIHNTANADFKAGQEISLEDGFDVQSGSSFHAFISSTTCSSFNERCSGNSSTASLPIKGASNTILNLNNQGNILSSPSDTSVSKLVITIGDSTSITGTIDDTITLSRCISAVWDTTSVMDSIAQKEYSEDSSTIVIKTDTLKIVFLNDSLQQEIDQKVKAELLFDGTVLIYKDQDTTGGGSIAHARPPQVTFFPNPGRNEGTILYDITKRSSIKLQVINELGTSVDNIINSRESNAGRYLYNYNLSKLNIGVYYLRLQSGNEVATTKIQIIR